MLDAVQISAPRLIVQDKVAGEDLIVRRTTITIHSPNIFAAVSACSRSELVHLYPVKLRDIVDKLMAGDHETEVKKSKKTTSSSALGSSSSSPSASQYSVIYFCSNKISTSSLVMIGGLMAKVHRFGTFLGFDCSRGFFKSANRPATERVPHPNPQCRHHYHPHSYRQPQHLKARNPRLGHSLRRCPLVRRNCCPPEQLTPADQRCEFGPRNPPQGHFDCKGLAPVAQEQNHRWVKQYS